MDNQRPPFRNPPSDRSLQMTHLMDETVKEICESMKNDPDRWRIETHKVTHTKTGTMLWHSYANSITEIWTGHATEEVFTYEQGLLIAEAFKSMAEYKATASQQKVINSFKPKPSYTLHEVERNPKWYEFWK